MIMSLRVFWTRWGNSCLKKKKKTEQEVGSMTSWIRELAMQV
jgi:hypothetical protein